MARNAFPNQQQPRERRAVKATKASGQTLSAPKVDSVNTFDAPNIVAPKALAAKVASGKLTITVAPASVTVLGLE